MFCVDNGSRFLQNSVDGIIPRGRRDAAWIPWALIRSSTSCFSSKLTPEAQSCGTGASCCGMRPSGEAGTGARGADTARPCVAPASSLRHPPQPPSDTPSGAPDSNRPLATGSPPGSGPCGSRWDLSGEPRQATLACRTAHLGAERRFTLMLGTRGKKRCPQHSPRCRWQSPVWCKGKRASNLCCLRWG